MREPETLLGRRVEAAILDHANPRVLDGHVLAAAFEAPLDDADRDTLGDEALERAAVLPELKKTPAGYVWAGRDYPAARVSLRSASPDPVLDRRRRDGLGARHRRARARLLDRRTRARSTSTSASSTSSRRSTSRPGRRSSTPFTGDWYTQAKKETTTAIEERPRASGGSASTSPSAASSVTEQVVAYQRKRARRQRCSTSSPLDLPPTDVRDRGGLVPARSPGSSRASSGCRSCSARSTPPSTR